MATQLLGRREVLDELEDHLRDEVDALTRAGHPPDEAVRAAAARLGSPSDVGAEFAKVPPTFAPWLPVRIAWIGGALLAASMVLPLWPKLAAGGLASLLATHMGLVMLGYVSTLLVGFLAASYLVARLFAGLADGQVRTLQRAGLSLSALAVSLTGVGVAFGFIFCPHEKTGWAFGYDTREVGGLVVLAWNLVMLAGCWAGRRSANPAAVMMLGLVGSMAVVLGWLGATAVEHRLHGAPADFATVAAVVSAQLAVACLGFAPAGCLRRAGA